jgi:flagellar motor switch protein FliN
MTEAAAAAVALKPALFIQVWVESFVQVLVQIGSPLQPTALADAPAGLAPAGGQDFWIICVCSGGLRGEMSLRIPASSIRSLAQILTGEPPAAEAEPGPEHREAALELVRQVGGFVVTACKPHWGEVQLHLEAAAAAPSWPASSTTWIRVGEEERTTAFVEVHLSAALAAALRAETVQVEKPLAGAAEALSSGAQPASSAEQAANAKQGKVKLDLLLGVELAVTLRFGSRRLPLRDVLDLNPGSVIELDRQVQEPVDMLLDGRLVARGEVVVMDGNYGLRVTEVAPGL